MLIFILFGLAANCKNQNFASNKLKTKKYDLEYASVAVAHIFAVGPQSYIPWVDHYSKSRIDSN